MSVTNAVGLVASAALIVYLFLALLFPERF